MIDEAEVQAVHAEMLARWRGGRLAEAAAMLDRLEGCSSEQLNGGALADLWWTFCEHVGDALAKTDRDRAMRLYDLAIASFAKEGSYATGAGEGMNAVADRRRVETKRAAL
jgi:hypothetical protein